MKKQFFVYFLALSGSLAYGQAPPDYPPAPAPRTVVRAEYFFDTDPGAGNATAIAITPSANVNFSGSLNLNGNALNPGFHRFYIRTQDDRGKWSLTYTALFDNVPIPAYPNFATPPDIIDVEYFIDNDPGLGNGKKITVPAQTNIVSFNALVDVSGIAPGAHKLFIRSRNANGKWSLTYFSAFDNTALTPYPNAPAPVSVGNAEYYFDVDPGFGNGLPITLQPGNDVTFSGDLPLGSLTRGRHTIYIRSRQNPWSMSAYAEFMFGNALPVTWNYVKAEAKDKDAFINWATGFEQNAAKFIIEVSKDGINYTTAGEVPAKNNAAGSSYSFKHINPGAGTSYYRIKQVDTDGNFTYSKVVLILFNNGLRQPLLFPNPATSVVHVYMPQAADKIELYDAGGRFIKSIKVVEGNSTLSVPITDLAEGRYVLTIIKGKERTSYNFVKN